MNASGMLGFAPDFRTPVPWDEFGAFVTNPVSRTPRQPATVSQQIEYPGGFLLHSGLPNPGLQRVVQQYARRWEDSSLPIIVHLIADAPDVITEMVQELEDIENILAIELGFPNNVEADWPLAATRAATGELPLIVALTSEQASRLAQPVIDAGAAAVSLSAPRGALMVDGKIISGRLYGPGLFPQALETVRQLVENGIPVIGGNGVYKREQAEAMRETGALGVQLDTVLWQGNWG